jgi:hypothetical protein
MTVFRIPPSVVLSGIALSMSCACSTQHNLHSAAAVTLEPFLLHQSGERAAPRSPSPTLDEAGRLYSLMLGVEAPAASSSRWYRPVDELAYRYLRSGEPTQTWVWLGPGGATALCEVSEDRRVLRAHVLVRGFQGSDWRDERWRQLAGMWIGPAASTHPSEERIGILSSARGGTREAPGPAWRDVFADVGERYDVQRPGARLEHSVYTEYVRGH